MPDPGGEVAVHDVTEVQLTDVPASAPKVAVVAPGTNPKPVTVTTVPPITGPVTGAIPVTPGIDAYVNWSALKVAEVPPAVVTVMLTVPVPGGEVLVHEVVDVQVTDVPVAPKVAVVAPGTNPVPVKVTTVPPARGPASGAMPATKGIAW